MKTLTDFLKPVILALAFGASFTASYYSSYNQEKNSLHNVKEEYQNKVAKDRMEIYKNLPFTSKVYSFGGYLAAEEIYNQTNKQNYEKQKNKMTSLKGINLNEPVKQVYELYRSGDYLIFPSYKKDFSLSGKPLEEIQDFLLRKQKPALDGDSYSVLEKITEKKGALICKFRDVHGYRSSALIYALPAKVHFYKIVPKLKLQ